MPAKVAFMMSTDSRDYYVRQDANGHLVIGLVPLPHRVARRLKRAILSVPGRIAEATNRMPRMLFPDTADVDGPVRKAYSPGYCTLQIRTERGVAFMSAVFDEESTPYDLAILTPRDMWRMGWDIILVIIFSTLKRLWLDVVRT